jgi:hypothetical protein
VILCPHGDPFDGIGSGSLHYSDQFLFGEEAVKKDKVYECLVNPSVELDDLTCQILELLFSSFQIVCSRQLKDHLEGGKYFTNWSSDLLAESSY